MQFAVTRMALSLLFSFSKKLPNQRCLCTCLRRFRTALKNARSEEMKRIKNKMRNRMGQERLNMLSLINIENETLRTVDFSTELIFNLRRSSPVYSDCQRKVFEY
jgi:Sec-independent protein translocase protein TatA